MSARPKLIRRVIKADRKGKPKVVRDYRLLYTMELIIAQTRKVCDGHNCDAIYIYPGEGYGKVTSPNHARYMGGRTIPVAKCYHLSCVPEKLRPMTRFFRLGDKP